MHATVRGVQIEIPLGGEEGWGYAETVQRDCSLEAAETGPERAGVHTAPGWSLQCRLGKLGRARWMLHMPLGEQQPWLGHV